MSTRVAPPPNSCFPPRPQLLTVPLLAAALVAAACGGPASGPGTPGSSADTAAATDSAAGKAPWFRDATAASGLDFHHFNGSSGNFPMVEILGAGGALLDYDGDGDLDAYLVQGAMVEPGRTLDDAIFPPRHPVPLSDRLYRNDLEVGPDGRPTVRFTDVTETSGLAALTTGYGMGVAVGDYDGDGDPDLYVTNFGPNQLLRNQGDGTFEDATAEAGVGDPGWSVPAAFFDHDGDGDLDLFVGNYVEFDWDDLPVCRDLTGAPDFCGPKVFAPQADRLYENRGDGTFRDVTTEAGLHGPWGPALGVVVADFDGDGRTDLYVANDAWANHLWMNRGDGTYEDRALLAGAAVDEGGRAQGSMGVDAGDFDGDGDLDLFMTHIKQETNTLYRNVGGGMFEDHSAETGLGAPSLPYTGFGTAWADLDNDGWLDLLVVNGAVTKILPLVRQGDPYPLHQPNQLFRNLGGEGAVGRFADVTAGAGPVFELSEVSRGAAFGDVDEDGDVDVLLTNNNGPARLLINERGQDRPWIGLRLLTAAGTDAVGARAAVLRGDAPHLWRRVRLEGSYAVSNDPRILLGLGAGGSPIDGVRVVWADGRTEDFPVTETGRYHTLPRGTGRPVEGPPGGGRG